jgi:hypothetical protein
MLFVGLDDIQYVVCRVLSSLFLGSDDMLLIVVYDVLFVGLYDVLFVGLYDMWFVG